MKTSSKVTVINNISFVKAVPDKPFVISTNEKDYLVVWDCASKRTGKKGYYVLYNLESGKSCSRHFVKKDDKDGLAKSLHAYFENEGKQYNVVASEFELNNPDGWDAHEVDASDIPFVIATPNKNYFVGYDCKNKIYVAYNLATGNSCFRFTKVTQAVLDRYFASVTYEKGNTVRNVDWLIAQLTFTLED